MEVFTSVVLNPDNSVTLITNRHVYLLRMKPCLPGYPGATSDVDYVMESEVMTRPDCKSSMPPGLFRAQRASSLDRDTRLGVCWPTGKSRWRRFKDILRGALDGAVGMVRNG